MGGRGGGIRQTFLHDIPINHGMMEYNIVVYCENTKQLIENIHFNETAKYANVSYNNSVMSKVT